MNVLKLWNLLYEARGPPTLAETPQEPARDLRHCSAAAAAAAAVDVVVLFFEAREFIQPNEPPPSGHRFGGLGRRTRFSLGQSREEERETRDPQKEPKTLSCSAFSM